MNLSTNSISELRFHTLLESTPKYWISADECEQLALTAVNTNLSIEEYEQFLVNSVFRNMETGSTSNDVSSVVHEVLQQLGINEDVRRVSSSPLLAMYRENSERYSSPAEFFTVTQEDVMNENQYLPNDVYGFMVNEQLTSTQIINQLDAIGDTFKEQLYTLQHPNIVNLSLHSAKAQDVISSYLTEHRVFELQTYYTVAAIITNLTKEATQIDRTQDVTTTDFYQHLQQLRNEIPVTTILQDLPDMYASITDTLSQLQAMAQANESDTKYQNLPAVLANFCRDMNNEMKVVHDYIYEIISSSTGCHALIEQTCCDENTSMYYVLPKMEHQQEFQEYKELYQQDVSAIHGQIHQVVVVQPLIEESEPMQFPSLDEAMRSEEIRLGAMIVSIDGKSCSEYIREYQVSFDSIYDSSIIPIQLTKEMTALYHAVQPSQDELDITM